MKKAIYILLLLLGCAATGFAGYYLAAHKMLETDEAPSYVVQSPVTETTTGTSADVDDTGDDDADITEITFTASGDNLIHSYLYKQAAERASAEGNDEGYDFSYAYEKVAPFFEETDFNWINQETLVSDTLEPSSYPKFSTPGDVVRTLIDDNFTVFNLSTNHTYDKGAEGLNATESFWKSMPEDVLSTGLVKKNKYSKIPIKTVEGINFAFLSYTYGTNGMSTPEESDTRVIYISEADIIKKQIKKARKLADIVIVSCHWGTENSHTITDSQRSMARQLTAWGADLIIGTHPHVVQDAEWVKAGGRKAFCAYSLGNFISGQDVADNLIGATLSLTFEVKEDMLDETYTVSIKKPKLIPTVTDYRSGHANIRVFFLKDYKKKWADTHGVRQYDTRFSYDYIYEVLENTVKKKFLELP